MTDLQHFSTVAHVNTVAPAPRRRRAPLVISAVAAAALAFGGATAAYAATSTDGSSDSSSSSSEVAERPAHEPRMHGTVVSVSGSTITLTDHDGFTRVINTSSDTEYADDLTSDLAVGTEIHARGTVNSDGTSLDATTIGTPPTPGDGSGPGRGGPHGNGEHPTPPADDSADDTTDDSDTTS